MTRPVNFQHQLNTSSAYLLILWCCKYKTKGGIITSSICKFQSWCSVLREPPWQKMLTTSSAKRDCSQNGLSGIGRNTMQLCTVQRADNIADNRADSIHCMTGSKSAHRGLVEEHVSFVNMQSACSQQGRSCQLDSICML